MASIRQQLWNDSPWAAGDGRVSYGTADGIPVAYDCFDRRIVHNFSTYVVGDGDTGATGVVLSILSRYADDVGARVFVIDYADTDAFGNVTGEETVTLNVVPALVEEDLVPMMCDLLDDGVTGIVFRLGDVAEQERGTVATGVADAVLELSGQSPETKDILLVTGFDALCGDAGGERLSVIGRAIREGRRHLLSVWLAVTRIPGSDGRLFWDMCSTKLLFAMPARDSLWCSGELSLSWNMMSALGMLPLAGPPVIPSITRGNGNVRYGRFAIVLRGSQAAQIVVDAV